MTNKVKTAQIVAKFCHAKQRYGDGEPYERHLKDVVNVLKEFGFDNEANTSSAWLHDIIEDTKVTKNMIEENFGKEIAGMVYAVTNELGVNRVERNLKTYQKLLKYPKALPIKLADRIANVRYSKSKGNSSFYKMYKKEYPSFRAALYSEGRLYKMWEELDKLME